MAQRVDSIFQAYDFSDEELAVASTFSELQTQYLKTELSIKATLKVGIPYETENPDKFRLTHEYDRGWMECLQYLLGTSEMRQSELIKALSAQQESQKL